jgi:predicted lysophospholipase L1 biosynthesis ABC-type transport system permease subunit
MFEPGRPMIEIVGVVGDVLADGLQSTPWPRLYVHYAQADESAYGTPSDVYLVVRAGGDAGRGAGATGDPAALAEPVRRAIHEIEPAAAVWNVATMAEVRREAAAAQEFPTVLLTVFGAVALLLAAIGIYGMVSYMVGRRTREIGVRMALGARGSDVRRMVVVQALLPVGVGLLLGLTAAMHTTELLGSLLYGVSPLDPLTYAGVALILALVAALASYLPARRATRVEPMVVLRGE